MNKFELVHDEVIDLGQASVETKGNALFEIDVSTGKLSYATGIADD